MLDDCELQTRVRMYVSMYVCMYVCIYALMSKQVRIHM